MAAVSLEQHVPGWDRSTIEGTDHAVLDIVLAEPAATVALDVTIVEVTAPDPVTARARARKDGIAARTREREKHRRYPSPGLCAAVLETGGRHGQELRAFLRAKAPYDARRSEARQDVRQRLAVALQRGVADALLTSAGKRPRPWLATCPALRGGAARRRRQG